VATKKRIADRVLEPPESTVLDVLDRLLDKGVMANGDVTLGVAGVDLVYVRLSALLCASDRVLPGAARRRTLPHSTSRGRTRPAAPAANSRVRPRTGKVER
jgi:hypothetical protein